MKNKIEEKIKNLETSKEICEEKLLEVLNIAKEQKLKVRNFFIQEITHKNGLGGGTEKKDVIEYAIAYFEKGNNDIPRTPYVFRKQDSAMDILERLKHQVVIY